MAGCRVTCFGAPFYAGWGLTDDRQDIVRRKGGIPFEGLIAAAYQDYDHYFDAWTRAPVDVFTAADQLAFLLAHFQRHWRPGDRLAGVEMEARRHIAHAGRPRRAGAL